MPFASIDWRADLIAFLIGFLVAGAPGLYVLFFLMIPDAIRDRVRRRHEAGRGKAA